MMGCWQSFYLFEILPKCKKCSLKVFPFSEKKRQEKGHSFQKLWHIWSLI
jgi:hypothetical protein